MATSFVEMSGDFSPDGRWVAYSSDETGRDEVYIRPFPKADGQWRVSTDGGTNPRWRPDGRELFYIAPDRKLMSVSITARPIRLPSPRRGRSSRRASAARSAATSATTTPSAATASASLIVTDEGQPSSPPITVIVNWPELLKRNK